VARKTIEVQRALAALAALPAAAARIRALAAGLPMAIASGALRPGSSRSSIVRARGVFHGDRRCRRDAAQQAAPRSMSWPSSGCPLRRPPAPARRVVGVEDTLQGLASARAAGLRTIAVTTTCRASDVTAADYVTADISGVTIEVLRHVVGDAR
jgi:sugar-phosphatase